MILRLVCIGTDFSFIENVLGFYNIDATRDLIEWHKKGQGEQGLRNLRFGSTITDIVANGQQVQVKSNKPYTLKINGKKYRIKEGEQIITIKP